MAASSRFIRGCFKRLPSSVKAYYGPVITSRNSSNFVPVDDMISGLNETQIQVIREYFSLYVIKICCCIMLYLYNEHRLTVFSP